MFHYQGKKKTQKMTSLPFEREQVLTEQNIRLTKSLLCIILGVNSTKEQEALFFLLDNLKKGFYLGSQRQFAKDSGLSIKPVTSTLSILSKQGLIKVNRGYVEVSKELINLFKQAEQEGQTRIVLDIKNLPNQTTLDLETPPVDEIMTPSSAFAWEYDDDEGYD